MQELTLVGNLISALTLVAVGAGFPPLLSGAFWALVTVYGLISILFDDETLRGVPGIEVIQQLLNHRRELREQLKQRGEEGIPGISVPGASRRSRRSASSYPRRRRGYSRLS